MLHWKGLKQPGVTLRLSWALGWEKGRGPAHTERQSWRKGQLPRSVAPVVLGPLFVVFRPENPSGFDSGGLRLASEVKRVRAQIEFLTNFEAEESWSSHTK